MRKYLIIFVTLTFLLSCNGGVTDGGVDIGKDPVSECVVPASARCGDEVILQWNGFADDASIILRTSAGEGFSVDLQVITESGLIFKVPHGLVPGKYDIVLLPHLQLRQEPQGSSDFRLRSQGPCRLGTGESGLVLG